MLTFGRELNSPFTIQPIDPDTEDLEQGTPTAYAEHLTRGLATAFAETIRNCNAARERQEFYYNSGRRPSPFKTGDLVWKQSNILSDAMRGITSSLAPKFEGPYKLSHAISTNVFELEDMDGRPAGRRNVDQLRLYRAPPDWTEESPQAEEGSIVDAETAEESDWTEEETIDFPDDPLTQPLPPSTGTRPLHTTRPPRWLQNYQL